MSEHVQQHPEILTPGYIRKNNLFPGGRNALYDLFRRQDFPAVRHGKKLFVSRDAFFRWWENEGKNTSA